MKRNTTLVIAAELIALALMVPVAYAQTAVGTSVGASGYGYASPGGAVSSGPAIVVSPPTPIAPPAYSGFIQFNNLTVESVSGANPPAEILASNPNIYPLMGASASAGVTSTSVSAMAPPVAPAAASSGSCYAFDTRDSATGKPTACPTPPTLPSTTTTTAPDSAPSATASGNAASSIAYPPTSPIRYQPYRIEVDSSTRLLLNDRTAATLNSFSSGDQINVFGYYNGDGSIQAYLIRDLSKPAQDEFIQLNNVDLVSVSSATIPAALVVAQAQGYPCYGFGTSGAVKQSIACPMGVMATTNSPALANLSVPAALAPNWQLLRKYVVTVDAQTVILDANRARLSLADLQVGDQLNVYGDTTDNGQTLKADIVRDLSIPATPSTYSGKVTQVNTDGSFVIQTSGGQTITVQSGIQVGAAVRVTGLLDRLKNVLSQVSNIGFGGSGLPVPMPMMQATGG